MISIYFVKYSCAGFYQIQLCWLLSNFSNYNIYEIIYYFSNLRYYLYIINLSFSCKITFPVSLVHNLILLKSILFKKCYFCFKKSFKKYYFVKKCTLFLLYISYNHVCQNSRLFFYSLSTTRLLELDGSEVFLILHENPSYSQLVTSRESRKESERLLRWALGWGIRTQPKIYQKEIEILEYLITNCAENTKNNKRINQILGEKGISWMKKILGLRKEDKIK